MVYALLVGLLQYRTTLLPWFIGLMIGLLLVLMDRWLYVWWLKPYEQLSIQIHYWWQRRDFIGSLKLLIERGNEQTKLMLNSMGMAVIWPLLTIYLITSTGSVVAAGIILGLGCRLTLLLMRDWKDPVTTCTWFCWQIKRPLSLREVRVAVGTYLGCWLIINLLLLTL